MPPTIRISRKKKSPARRLFPSLAGGDGARHVLRDGAPGYPERLGDLGKAPAVDAIEEEDMPCSRRQGGERGIDAAKLLPGSDGVVGRDRRGGPLLGQDAAEEIAAPFLCPDVVYRGIARAAREIGGRLREPLGGPFPKADEDIVDEIACSAGAADAAGDLTFETLVLGDIERSDFLCLCVHQTINISSAPAIPSAAGGKSIPYERENSLARAVI